MTSYNGQPDKIAILKYISIFAGTPDDILEEIAAILQKEIIPTGKTIFQKSDIGSSMYIIYSGRIRIHDGSHTLALLGSPEIFGELALLDPEPRSASATAVQDSVVYKMDQEAFYGIMSSRIEITRGILKVLCQRLRSQNKLISNLKGHLSSAFNKF